VSLRESAIKNPTLGLILRNISVVLKPTRTKF
jgi:hypothetical protein